MMKKQPPKVFNKIYQNSHQNVLALAWKFIKKGL